jgi:hypothetical protein
MAFTAEDGTGVVGANSYATIAQADSYFTDRGNTTWVAYTDQLKQSALINATDYMTVKNAGKWIGVEQFPDNPQGLDFPRMDMAGYADGVPAQIVQACCEYASRWAANPSTGLIPDPTIDATGRTVTRLVEQVGPIKEDTQYDSRNGSVMYTWRPYPYADALVKPFLTYVGGVIRN